MLSELQDTRSNASQRPVEEYKQHMDHLINLQLFMDNPFVIGS